ncbi:hypothetical protein HYDPIDRAFT_55055, partial [Hydnomerulius pinastri MD-312]
MTPHRHWMRNYAPKRVPIRLADHTVVYSAGSGSVVFNPVVRGRPSSLPSAPILTSRPVEFTRVLHVPGLRN